MMKPPAFQFYVDNFVEGTCDLTAHEVGCYVRLLCFQWTRGQIPHTNPEKIARIAGGEVSQDVLSKFKNGKNSRMEIEREKQAEFRAGRAEAGKAGANKRWHSYSTANGKAIAQPMANTMANTMANDSFPSPSPSPSPSPFPPTTTTKLPTKATKKLLKREWETARRVEIALGEMWVNDAGKWISRIKMETEKSERVISEVENAIKERRISTTPAQYAEQIWKEFK